MALRDSISGPSWTRTPDSRSEPSSIFFCLVRDSYSPCSWRWVELTKRRCTWSSPRLGTWSCSTVGVSPSFAAGLGFRGPTLSVCESRMVWTLLMSPAMEVGKQARRFIRERGFCVRVLRLNKEAASNSTC